jgi:hypothetical protein
MSRGWVRASVPFLRPTALRAASTITTSRIVCSS